jgi:23S rRNA pseudouridine1911/1915/1917 synthase
VTYSFTVEQPGRLDQFLVSQLATYSRSKLQRLIEAGHVNVDGVEARTTSHQLLPGQQVKFVEPAPDPKFPEAQAIPLTVIFEDEALLVVDKPAGMITHPNTFKDQGTLVNALLAHCPSITEALYDPENPISRLRPGIVHRLDKDTSGLIVVAKTRAALLALAEQFHKRTVEKEYETLLYGDLKEARTVSAPIHRKGNEKHNIMVASHDQGQGRTAVTHFEPQEVYAPYAKWPTELATRTRVKIETGRTHQIRVHAKFIGHPVLGDHLYTHKPATSLSERLGLSHQQLRAVSLKFRHPTTKREMTFEV